MLYILATITCTTLSINYHPVESGEVVRGADPVRGRVAAADGGQPVRTRGRERVGEVYAAEDPGGRVGAQRGHGDGPPPGAGRHAAAGPLRVRGGPEPRRRADGEPGAMGGAEGEGGSARAGGRPFRRRSVRGRRGDRPPPRWLLGRGARGRDPGRARDSRGSPYSPALDLVRRVQA